MLPSVYSAIGEHGRVPHAFIAGELSLFHSGGDPTAAYRPVTLVNTGYRILAKVLANWHSPEMAATIGPERKAFLPGRLIGDKIIFIPLLPSLQLLCSNSSLIDLNLASKAVTAFLDLRKACDTVLRPFLYKVLGAKGVGEDFIHWVMFMSETSTAPMSMGTPPSLLSTKPVSAKAAL